ncbi:hypothetical protein [Gordonia sp. NPDC003585]|uniref:hypothetical protein n=1 Tax=Gordonia sp. NPDC003585 TaxID=3154275 RepID=UPI0033A249BA
MKKKDRPDAGLQLWQLVVTVVLLLIFGTLAVILLAIADTDPEVWQRRVYIFTAIQAIVFTAVGWLFGREVNQSAVKAADMHASEARDDANEARASIRQLAQRAGEAERTAAVEEARGRAAYTAVASLLDSDDSTSSGPSDVSMPRTQPDNVRAAVAILDALYSDQQP